MGASGDAAEQVVRMSLEGSEYALRIAGKGAKELAVFLYAAAQGSKRTKGRTRLVSLLKSGKELNVFSLPESYLKRFAQEAKKYGVLYAALRGMKKSGDGITDIMVRAEDASKINRIFELYLYTAIAPVPLAAFAGEPTANIGRRFLKSYAAVCIEGAVIVMACIIYTAFVSTTPTVDASASAVNMVWKYVGELIFGMLVLVGTVKMADRVSHEMFGV